jgi:hypothetical protein
MRRNAQGLSRKFGRRRPSARELAAGEAAAGDRSAVGLPARPRRLRRPIDRARVEYHLHKVFTKLETSSRHQFEHALPAEPGAAARTGASHRG